MKAFRMCHDNDHVDMPESGRSGYFALQQVLGSFYGSLLFKKTSQG